MPKTLSLGEIIRETFELLKSQPIVLAPMLICSVGLTVVQLLVLGQETVPKDALAYMALGSVTVSLWFQLWTLSMVHLFITKHDIDLKESLLLAFRAWAPVLILYIATASLLCGLGYLLYLQPFAFNMAWVLLGPVVLVLGFLFLILVLFLPVILIVESYPLLQNIGYVWLLLRFRARWVLRWVLINLLFLIMVASWSLVFVKFPILPPLIQGLASAFGLGATYFFYLHLTRVDVVG